jgi:hypothetical protein
MVVGKLDCLSTPGEIVLCHEMVQLTTKDSKFALTSFIR